MNKIGIVGSDHSYNYYSRTRLFPVIIVSIIAAVVPFLAFSPSTLIESSPSTNETAGSEVT